MIKENNTKLSYIDLLSILHTNIESDSIPYESKQHILGIIETLEQILKKYS